MSKLDILEYDIWDCHIVLFSLITVDFLCNNEVYSTLNNNISSAFRKRKFFHDNNIFMDSNLV